MNLLLKLVAAIVLILLGKFIFNEHLGTHMIAHAIIFFVTLVFVELGSEIIKHRKHIWQLIQCKFIYRRKDIRLSIAYLFRINVDGKYLLVKSRLKNAFQPVGGAYKTLPGSEKIFTKLGVRPDRLVETEHGIAKNDLRVYVKGIDVFEFLNWFNSKEDREISPWREFCEELISTNILPWKEFRFINYRFKGIVRSPIINLDSGGKGMFLFEIYDLVINDEQYPILRDLARKGNTDNYIWVDDYLIQRLGHNESTRTHVYEILPHTKFAQNLKWSKE